MAPSLSARPSPLTGVEYIVVATTRPETMLGDTGVAVSPKDHDKDKFVGAKVKLPIVDREIPIFSDFYVDADFGSGFVKVTPAHDPNDFAMGERHGLEKINIFDETAHVVEGYGEFTGMSREECREAVVAWFEEHGLLDHVEDHHHSVMHCYRCPSALEPWLSEQWFVAVDKLKGPATEAVTSGEVTFHPARWTQTYLTWMENLKDWCISRQLWWGHRIPVFYCDAIAVGTDALHGRRRDVCPNCGAPSCASGRRRARHVVLKPAVDVSPRRVGRTTPSRLEGPSSYDGARHRARHHRAVGGPHDHVLHVLLWARFRSMTSSSMPPFWRRTARRMSKSKGNGVDPMDLIAKYGADAMRFNLLTLVTNNQDVRFDADIDPKDPRAHFCRPRTEQARAFVTKIWNASRFVLGNLEGFTPGEPVAATPADAWILSRLAGLSERVTQGISRIQVR